MLDKLIGPFLSGLLGFRPPPPKFELQEGSKRISPEYVEQLIMSVGRQNVFARAQILGWSPKEPPPPLWVWYQICLDLIREGAVDTGQGNQPLQ